MQRGSNTKSEKHTKNLKPSCANAGSMHVNTRWMYLGITHRRAAVIVLSS